MNGHAGSREGASRERHALRVRVEGLVQGVSFRASTMYEARALGVSGWVRNLPDGRVEALFVGPRDACERALAFVRTGPPHSRVERVDAKWEDPPADAPHPFEVR